MQYFVTLTVFIDDGIERSEEDIKAFVESKVATKSLSVENLIVEKVKHY